MNTDKLPTANQYIRRVLAETEFFNKNELHDYQRQQLTQLLKFAYSQAPFYRERLKHLFLDNGEINWQRWNETPIVKRKDIRECGDAMIAASPLAAHGPTYDVASSGTTGLPVTVRSTVLMHTAGVEAFGRACRWYGAASEDRSCVAFGSKVIESLDRQIWAIGDGETDTLAGNTSAKRLAVSQNLPAEKILSYMWQHGTTCFSGYPTVLEDLAEIQLKHHSSFNLKYAMGVSMALTERARALCRQAFRAPAFSAYTSKESHKMAHECPVSGGLHVNSELVLLEVLDDNDQPCETGETGRIIVTPLLGTAQPLIRYEQGDLGTWGEPCACGRVHPILSRIDGRIRNQFHFTGGHRFTPTIGHEYFRDVLKADRWQVAQIGPRLIEVRFMSSVPDSAIEFQRFTEMCRTSFLSDLQVTYRRVSAMPLTQAGKFIDYINEFEPTVN